MKTEQLEQFEQLGRRVMAWKHFEWRPGMFVVHPEGNNGHGYVYRLRDMTLRGPNDYPYVERHGTRLQLVLTALKVGRKSVDDEGMWSIEIGMKRGTRTSEDFVAALEAAP